MRESCTDLNLKKFFHDLREPSEDIIDGSHSLDRMVNASLAAIVNDRFCLLLVNIDPVLNNLRILVVGPA